MPRRRPRSRRRRARRPPTPLAAARPVPASAPARPAAPPVAGPTVSHEPPRERSVTRFTTRDYSYVRRELQRIVLLAGAIFILIVVLSFFLP